MMQEENVNLKINVGKRQVTVFDEENKSELFKLYVHDSKLDESMYFHDIFAQDGIEKKDGEMLRWYRYQQNDNIRSTTSKVY